MVLAFLPKGQKAGKDDVSDKSKDRIWDWSVEPAYGDDDNFYYRKKEQTKRSGAKQIRTNTVVLTRDKQGQRNGRAVKDPPTKSSKKSDG